MPEEEKRQFNVEAKDKGTRLDIFIVSQIKNISRNFIQRHIKNGYVKCSDVTITKPNYKVKLGEEIIVSMPSPQLTDVLPQEIPLKIIYRDKDLLVINKPAGMVVHPSPGHNSGTIVNAVLALCPEIKGIGGEIRPGIVHRLDKDTTGVMIIALNDFSMMKLAEQFKKGQVKKNYLAIVKGTPPLSGKVETLIGRNPVDRKKMCVRTDNGRRAITEYKVLEKFQNYSLVSVNIKTGRTHQIRVHMSYIGHPVVGDCQYGRVSSRKMPVIVNRQLLHAHSIEFMHPVREEKLVFTAELPSDFEQFLRYLRENETKLFMDNHKKAHEKA